MGMVFNIFEYGIRSETVKMKKVDKHKSFLKASEQTTDILEKARLKKKSFFFKYIGKYSFEKRKCRT